jgi:hypothetical protein
MCQIFLSDLINPGFSRQILIKDFNDKFNENKFSAIGFDTTGQTDKDRPTDTTKQKALFALLRRRPKTLNKI